MPLSSASHVLLWSVACWGGALPDEVHAEVAGAGTRRRTQRPAAWLGHAAAIALEATSSGALWPGGSAAELAGSGAVQTQQVGLLQAEGWMEGPVEVIFSPPAAHPGLHHFKG